MTDHASPDQLDPAALYHLATPAERTAADREGAIAPPSLATEGFVHCSWGHQVAGTLAKHFASVPVVVALRLDPTRISGLVEEDSYQSGQAFPHVYGPIPTAAVLDAVPVKGPA